MTKTPTVVPKERDSGAAQLIETSSAIKGNVLNMRSPDNKSLPVAVTAEIHEPSTEAGELQKMARLDINSWSVGSNRTPSYEEGDITEMDTNLLPV